MGSYILHIALAVLVFLGSCNGQPPPRISPNAPWSERIAESFLLRHPDFAIYDTGFTSTKWTYEQGLMLHALLEMWNYTGEQKYFNFVQKNLAQYVDPQGGIKTYKRDDYKLDDVLGGRSLLTLYAGTKDERWKTVAESLRGQLNLQPRTTEGGFWHKKIYPNQMWLDGLYMAEPFYAEYTAMFNDSAAFDDIARQFSLITSHATDSGTGLLYHGWDQSRNEQWANRKTGCSPSFWGRAMGWYGMALVDVLESFPRNHPQRPVLIDLLEKFASAVIKFRDKDNHAWHQIVDQGLSNGNYAEASASSMFVYTLAKGANRGYIDRTYYKFAEDAFQGITKNLVSVDKDGFIDLHDICQGAGLGGSPYRDGSFRYYVSVPRATNDPKGIGAFLLAAMEIEKGLAAQANSSK